MYTIPIENTLLYGTIFSTTNETATHQTQTEVQTMQKLTIKYNHKDFFGTQIYTEDTKENFTKADLTKAFLFLSKNNDAAVQAVAK